MIDSQWWISTSTNLKELNDSEAIPVYGWDYSDQFTYWPENALHYIYGCLYISGFNNLNWFLIFAEYPMTLSVLPDGDEELEDEKLYYGVYERSGTMLLHPQWKHTISGALLGFLQYPCK